MPTKRVNLTMLMFVVFQGTHRCNAFCFCIWYNKTTDIVNALILPFWPMDLLFIIYMLDNNGMEEKNWMADRCSRNLPAFSHCFGTRVTQLEWVDHNVHGWQWRHYWEPLVWFITSRVPAKWLIGCDSFDYWSHSTQRKNAKECFYASSY